MELPITADPEKINRLKGKIVLIKYGGNAMINEKVKNSIIRDIVALKRIGAVPVIVHGGGPAIKRLLQKVGMESEFVDGHRKTTPETMTYVEMALSGSVNSEIVRLINNAGPKAVGISGKDGRMVTAKKRTHRVTIDGKEKEMDLGHVGDVDKIDTDLIHTLINNDYLPVISPVSAGEDSKDYNVNADMFAGHLAGELQADCYVAMTNVDGLQSDPSDSSTLIREISLKKVQSEMESSIRGGMIPKVESCIIALREGTGTARIINGTQEHTLLKELLTKGRSGTRIQK